MCQAHSSDHGGPKIIASEELKIGFYAPAFLNWNLFVDWKNLGNSSLSDLWRLQSLDFFHFAIFDANKDQILSFFEIYDP